MTARDFAYWCQGLFEIGGDSIKTLDEKQVQIIKNHLNLVFVHDIDPQAGGPEVQAKLNEVHNQAITYHDNMPVHKPPTFPNGLIARC